MTINKSLIREILEIDINQNPSKYQKSLAIAKIIDPGAFAEWRIVDSSNNSESFNARKKYDKSVALHKSTEILKLLGIVGETDWHSILKEFHDSN